MRLGAIAALGGSTRGFAQTPIAADATTAVHDRFVSITSWPYEGDIDSAKTELKPLIRLMQQQPGFMTLSFIEDDTAIHLVTFFLDKETSDTALQVLDKWIDDPDRAIFDQEPERDSGSAFLRSQLTAGCRCTASDDDPCGTDELICCPLTDGERGLCMTAATICPVLGDEPEEESTDDPPAGSVGGSNCSGEGCRCTDSQSNTCDSGLSCCGADHPGGTGVCMTTCPCGNEGCACIAAVVNTCDDGLTCCAPGEIGGAGTCQYECSCTGEGCACSVGVDGTCNDDLSCCGIGSQNPGSIGVCLTACATDAYCPGSDGCECGDVWQCNDDLICCGADESGTGICQAAC